MTDSTTTTANLAKSARASLETTFSNGGHKPSVLQWAAIQDLLEHLQAAADGRVQPAVYLSAIPAGTGKSTSLAAFAAALCASAAHERTGMLILCNQVSEVRDMAVALAKHRASLHVICGEAYKEVRALGDHDTADNAQIVIATQASLRASLRGQPDFPLIERFHFQGAPRAVRCWDEAYAMRRPVIMDADKLGGSLIAAMRRQKLDDVQASPAAEALLELGLTLERMRASGPCTIPDFEGLGINFQTMADDAGDDEELCEQVKALRDVSGQNAWAYRDNLRGSCIVKHIPELPTSLLPVFVTDASAAVGVNNETYDQMGQSGVPIVRLVEASKTYRNLTIRLVPVAASRSAYTAKGTLNGLELIGAGVRYVRSVAPERVLVVSYKKTRFPLSGVGEKTIAEAIDKRLTETEQTNVSHLTWGKHKATNDHAAVRHVLLMGLNFLPPVNSYAESAALLDKPMSTAEAHDHPTKEQVNAIKRGRLWDSTLQAMLRGAARKGQDGDCGVCEVVIFQNNQSGLSVEEYLAMFPGATIKPDTSLLPRKTLKGKVGKLEDVVLAMMADGSREFVNGEIQKTMGMDRGSFRNLVKHPDWRMAMGWHGLSPQMLSGGRMGMRCV